MTLTMLNGQITGRQQADQLTEVDVQSGSRALDHYNQLPPSVHLTGCQQIVGVEVQSGSTGLNHDTQLPPSVHLTAY